MDAPAESRFARLDRLLTRDVQMFAGVARTIAHSPYLSPMHRVRALHSLADRTMRLVAPFMACRAGCAACCHIALSLNELEARAIGDATHREPAEVSGLFDPAAEIKRWRGKPCPFLVDRTCSIYALRPLNCRLHHSLETSADHCQHVVGSFEVHAANLSALRDAMVTATAGFKWADMREFFP